MDKYVTGAVIRKLRENKKMTQEELAEKAHNYELVESPYTVLCIDHRQSGIGSNSCGPELLEKYQLNPDVFSFGVRLIIE